MFQRRATATAVFALLAVGGVQAQTAPSDAGVQRVEVTGSSIRRISTEAAVPIQTLSSQDIARQGIVSVEQLVSSLTANGNGMDNLASNADVASGSARGNNGLSAANLRGQGPQSTLVLLNGRRLAPHGLNGGIVDLNQIPFAAIERVEILKDGASAIYGTDAVGGVINFILRRNHEGLNVTASTDLTQHGGGNIHRAGVTGGFGSLERDGFNVLVSLSASKNEALRGDDRDFVDTFQADRGLSPDTRGAPFATAFAISSVKTLLTAPPGQQPATFGNGNGPLKDGKRYNGINALALPGQPGCASGDGMGPYDAKLWNVAGGDLGCAWDTGRAAVIQQPLTTVNLVSRATFKAGEHQIFAEAVLGRAESSKRFSASQITSGNTATITLPDGVTKAPHPLYQLTYPATGPAYQGVYDAMVSAFPSLSANQGLPIAFRWRCIPCGGREIDTTSDTARLLLGADGPLPWLSGWDYRVGLSQAQSDSHSTLGSGYQYYKPLMGLLRQGVLNPFTLGPQTADAMSAMDAISARGTKLYGGKSTMSEVDVVVSGPVAKIGNADVMAAVGVDVRRESFQFNGDTIANSIDALVYNAPFDYVNTLKRVSRDVKAVFGEVQVPVTRSLELNLAVRHDRYDGFGSTTNPKVSLRFQPTRDLLVRGSYSTGFRVPTFDQQYRGLTESQYSGKDIVDPQSCPSLKVDANNPACAAITPNVWIGGKSDLQPEKSKQWNLGVMFSPMPQLTLGADFWDIRRDGTIQSLALSSLLANAAFFPDRFIRDATGALTTLDDRWVNAGATITRGVDLTARAGGEVLAGRWNVALEGTYLIDKKSKLVPAADFGASEIGRFTRTGDLGLRWKHSIVGSYTQGVWTGTLVNTYASGYLDYVPPGIANGTVTPSNWSPKVSSYSLWHASVRWTGIRNLGLTFGIKNLLDTKPPFAFAYDSDTGAGSSWEPRVADPRGRSFQLAVDYKFW